MSFLEWCKIIAMSAVTIGLLLCIFYGIGQVFQIVMKTPHSISKEIK